jgi:enoyl-CoA hydratase/carnithine racemase
MTVERRDHDGFSELVLARPDRRNAFTTELLAELRDHLRDASGPVLLTGAGEAFCAGADVRADDDADERFALMGELLRELRALEPPTLAAVHGPAIGGGWGLALACDLCFASRAAVFCLPELAKGYRLPEPLVRRLNEVAGPVRAAELMFAGTRWDAGDALAAGCVTRVFDGREPLLAAARELCAALAACPRRSIATAKPRGVTCP